MSASSFAEYAQGITDLLGSLIAGGLARIVNLKIEPRSAQRGLVAGVLAFEDDSELHFREYVDMTQPQPRIMYAYHYQAPSGALIFRYDNAAHRPALPQPEHRHTPDQVVVSRAPTLGEVLDEIAQGR